jgi:hypothetical protein
MTIDLTAANAALVQALTDLRSTQKLIPRGEANDINLGIPDNRIDWKHFTIPPRRHKEFVEFSLSLSLSQSGGNVPERLKELVVAMAPMLVLAEEFYLFQTSDKLNPIREKEHFDHPFPHVNINNWELDDGFREYGLLADADHGNDSSDHDWSKVSKPIHVPLLSDNNDSLWGKGIARAVFKGIAKLMSKTGKGNAGFALFLPTEVWADAATSGDDDSTTNGLTILSQMGVDVEVVPCQVLPKDEGLLINLVGDPIKIYYGQEAEIQVLNLDSNGVQHFRIVEFMQYVVRDPRSLVLLKFQQPTSKHSPNHEQEANK